MSDDRHAIWRNIALWQHQGMSVDDAALRLGLPLRERTWDDIAAEMQAVWTDLRKVYRPAA